MFITRSSEADNLWGDEAKRLHTEWWRLRRERQENIDASIARHAVTELLYDQPYEDNKRVRVAGPFTVESLSPHRVVSIDESQLRMNPDLTMADDLLKKTSAANLFTVFGEPDVTISHTPDGKIVVEVHGVDIYNPTTGEIRSSTTDDVACWFIDTDYNEESFFVRHAYFTGADQPYEKLKRTLRTEIDEAAWASLYSTNSRPFLVPKTGKIAVKVINHYGDEVLKVYNV